MICATCGEEMIKGYIQCRDGIYWDEKKRLISAIALSTTAIPLGDNVAGPFTGAVVTAYRCKKCKQIVINY